MNLHNEIMNIPVPHSVTHNLEHPDCKDMFSAYSYKIGHRDARHAAAELSLKAEAYIEILEDLLLESIGAMLGGNLTRESEMAKDILKALKEKVNK